MLKGRESKGLRAQDFLQRLREAKDICVFLVWVALLGLQEQGTNRTRVP